MTKNDQIQKEELMDNKKQCLMTWVSNPQHSDQRQRGDCFKYYAIPAVIKS